MTKTLNDQLNAQTVDAKLLEDARHAFKNSAEIKEKILTESSGSYLKTLLDMAKIISESIAKGGKLLLCGNGGSAADAQHLAAELLIRLRSDVNRNAIPAIPLALDTSSLTACGNDYGFEYLFERMLAGLGKPGDVLLGITTSGRSPNIIRALQYARQNGINAFGFLGSNGGPALIDCDLAFVVPSSNTNRVQESHITAGHVLMEMIEELLLASGKIQNVLGMTGINSAPMQNSFDIEDKERCSREILSDSI